MIPVLDLLQELGLPAQTLGPKANMGTLLPKKILSAAELKYAQDLIGKLR